MGSMTSEVRAHGAVAAQAVEAVAELAAGQRTLEQVVRWGLAFSPPRLVAEVVKQDEYTLDVVMPWGELFLVYDST